MKISKKLKYTLSICILAPLLMASTSNGCSDADVASANLSAASESFEVSRRVTLYNVINDVAMVTVEGLCSVEFRGAYSEVTCINDNGKALKHMLADSDNTTMIVEQMAPIGVSTARYRYIVKPSVLIPDIDLQ